MKAWSGSEAIEIVIPTPTIEEKEVNEKNPILTDKPSDISSLDAILQDILTKDTVKLKWHPDILCRSIDSLGMEHEFHEDGPLLPQPDDDEEKIVEDLEWDICLKLLRWKRRQFIRMLRKYLKVFVGKEKWLGKVLSKYDMNINMNPAEIKS